MFSVSDQVINIITIIEQSDDEQGYIMEKGVELVDVWKRDGKLVIQH